MYKEGNLEIPIKTCLFQLKLYCRKQITEVRPLETFGTGRSLS